MREYYDIEHIRRQSIKEKLINIIRLPIKWLDNYNVKSPNTTIIANSNFSKTMIKNAYGLNSVVVYPGINTKKYLKTTNINKINQVICVSAINALKNQDFIVDVLANTPEINRPTLLLLGNGSDKAYLSKIIYKCKLLKVKLKIKINVSENEKIRELQKSKIFIYAPVNEPFGLVVEEAIASGLPLLVYKHGGGYIEIVSNNNGIVMNNLDAELWGSVLNKLLADDERQVEFSEYNRKYAEEKLDSEYMNEEILRIVKAKL
jgi:glycosyltransferase involved in cell wall biosynthesis